MDDFLRFFDKKREQFPMHLDIYYGKISDWNINVWKKGCAEDYPGCNTNENGDVIIVQVQECDMELAFAKAHVQLKDWLSEFEGGY